MVQKIYRLIDPLALRLCRNCLSPMAKQLFDVKCPNCDELPTKKRNYSKKEVESIRVWAIKQLEQATRVKVNPPSMGIQREFDFIA